MALKYAGEGGPSHAVSQHEKQAERYAEKVNQREGPGQVAPAVGRLRKAVVVQAHLVGRHNPAQTSPMSANRRARGTRRTVWASPHVTKKPAGEWKRRLKAQG